MIYSAADLLAQRRLLGGLEPKNTSLTVERTDGISIDSILSIQLRQWYLDLLDHGDPRYLAPENIASEIPSPQLNAGASELMLPLQCRRAFTLRLRGWLRTAPILPASDMADTLRRQNNPYTAATVEHPVAVLTGDFGTEPRMSILAWPPASDSGSGAPVTALSAVVDRGEGVFILDPSALATLPYSDFLINI